MPKDFQQIRNINEQLITSLGNPKEKKMRGKKPKPTTHFYTLPTCHETKKHHHIHTFIASAIKAPSVGFPINVLFLIKASLHTQPA